MRCKDFQERLAEYSADALTAGEEELFSTHLQGCPECQEEWDALNGVLRRLEAAAPAAAPDLWDSFQAALARETGECEALSELLPAWAADELSPEEDARTLTHLEVCTSCGSEARAYRRSLEALRAVEAPAPDLWPAFAQKMAAQVTCSEASDLLPAYLAGDLLEAWNWPLEYHLETCAPCAAERLAYEKAEGVLARVAAAPVEVDLWPAFEARLEAERARRTAWIGWLAPAASAWRSLWEQPLVRPAFAAGMAALALVLLAPRLQSHRPAEAPVQQARVPGTDVSPLRAVEEPDAPAVVRKAPETGRPVPETSSRPASRRTPRRYRVAAPKRVAPRRLPRGPELAPRPKRAPAAVLVRRETPETPTTAPARDARWRGMTVAFNPDLAVPAPPASYTPPAPASMSGEMQQAVKRDFVEFAEVIEEIRDVAAAPLEAGSDAE